MATVDALEKAMVTARIEWEEDVTHSDTRNSDATKLFRQYVELGNITINIMIFVWPQSELSSWSNDKLTH